MLLSVFGLFVSVSLTLPLAVGGGLILKKLGWTDLLHALCFGTAGGVASFGLLAACLDRQHAMIAVWMVMLLGAALGAVAALTTRTLLARYGVIASNETPDGYRYRPAPWAAAVVLSLLTAADFILTYSVLHNFRE